MSRPSVLAVPVTVTFSSKVTVNSSTWPTLYMPSPGTEIAPLTTGTVPSTRMPLVEGTWLDSERFASLPAASRMALEPRAMAPTSMPLASRSPACTM